MIAITMSRGIVVVCFLVQGIGIGGMFMRGMLIQPFQAQFNASATAVVLSTTGIATFMAAIANPVFGRLLLRYPAKTIMYCGVLEGGIGYIGLAFVREIWQVAAMYSLIAFGIAASFLACQTLIANWFITRRGQALGIAAAGMYVFGLLAAPATYYAEARIGLRATLAAVGLINLALLLPVWWFVVNKPEDKGLLPDGRTALESKVIGSVEERHPWTFKTMLMTGRFWLLLAIFFACNTAGDVVTNLILIAEHAKIDREAASYLLASESIGAVIGTIVSGRIFDRFGQRIFVRCWIVPLGIGFLLAMGQPSYVLLLVSGVALGLGIGAQTVALGALAGANFGRHAVAFTIGIMYPLIGFFSVANLSVLGRLYDFRGNLDAALVCYLIALGGVALLSTLLPGSAARPMSSVRGEAIS